MKKPPTEKNSVGDLLHLHTRLQEEKSLFFFLPLPSFHRGELSSHTRGLRGVVSLCPPRKFSGFAALPQNAVLDGGRQGEFDAGRKTLFFFLQLRGVVSLSHTKTALLRRFLFSAKRAFQRGKSVLYLTRGCLKTAGARKPPLSAYFYTLGGG